MNHSPAGHSTTETKHARLSRREALAQAGILLGGAAAGLALPAAAIPAEPPAAAGAVDEFIFCLNTATLRGQKLGLAKEIEVASQAGYQAIEPWISSIEDYQKAGGKLPELRQRLADSGLMVASAIGFPQWIVDDPARRAAGVEQARRDMDLVAQLGGKRMAAPPAGATENASLDLRQAAERYHALLELGGRMGVQPMLELWGFSKCLNRLSEVVFVAIEAGHPQACVLADVFHLHKGGSAPAGLRLLSSTAMPVFHLNDYPAEPAREKITDAHRIYPGDGVAPLPQILRDVRRCGGPTVLSLELFNADYYKQDALAVARTGLAKMKAVAAQSRTAGS